MLMAMLFVVFMSMVTVMAVVLYVPSDVKK